MDGEGTAGVEGGCITGVESEGVETGVEGVGVNGEIEGNAVGERIRVGECVDTDSGSIEDTPTDAFTEGKIKSIVGDNVEEGINPLEPKMQSVNEVASVLLDLLLDSEWIAKEEMIPSFYE